MSLKRIRITKDDIPDMHGINISCYSGSYLDCRPGDSFRFMAYSTPSYAFSLENGGEIIAIRTDGGRFSGEGWNGSAWNKTPGTHLEVIANASGTDEVKSIEIFYRDHTHKYVNGVCDCGAKALDFDTLSLVLSGELGLNFYTVVHDAESVKDGYMLFEIGNKGEAQKVNFSDAVLCDDGRYVFRCNLNVLQMADTITVSYHYGDITVGPKTTSVQSYIHKLIQNHDYNFDDPTVKLAKSIVNYGHYAQLGQQEVRDFVLGEDYAVTNNLSDVEIANAADLEQFMATKTGSVDGIAKVTRSLSLDHGTDINLYFTVKGDYVPNVGITDKNGDAAAFNLEKLSDGRNLLVIPQISAHQLGDIYTVTVDGTMTITVSALSYAYSVLNSDKSDAQKLTVSALYEYYKAAMDYRNAQ